MTSPRFLSWHQILSLYLPATLLSLGQSIDAPVLPVYARTFDVSFSVASLVFVATHVGALVITFPAGYLIDKIGRRPVLLAGPFLTAFAFFMTPFSGSFTELLVYRFIAGAATVLWQQTRLAVIADTVEYNQRARQMNWMMGMSRIGTLIGPALGGFLAAGFGLWVPFHVHAVLALLAIIPSFKLIPESAPGRARDSQGRVSAAEQQVGWRQVFAYMLTFQMMVFLVVQMSANVARGGYDQGALNLYAVYKYDVGPDVLGIMNTLAIVFGLPVPFLTGWLMDKFGRKFVIVPGFALYATSLVVVAVTALLDSPFLAFIAGYVMVQFTVGTIGGTMQVLGTDFSPSFARGRFFAIWRTLAQVGSTASPAVYAIVAEKVSYGAGFLTLAFFGYLVSFLVMAVLKVRPVRGEGMATRD